MMDERQAELVAALRGTAEGDRAAFRALYQRTSPKLFAVIRRILRQEGAAEEALQEAYVRIWRRAGDFDAAIASPIAWMTTIARHVAIDTLRQAAERVSAAGRDTDPALLEQIADPALPGTRADERRELSACLNGLEPERRGMVVLAYCYGLSREELATRFARPVATVKTLLRRSLIALKECLGER